MLPVQIVATLSGRRAKTLLQISYVLVAGFVARDVRMIGRER